MPHTKAVLVTSALVVFVTVVCASVVLLTSISLAEVLGITAVTGSLVSIYIHLADHFKKE